MKREFIIAGRAKTMNGLRPVRLGVEASDQEAAFRVFWAHYPRSEFAQVIEVRKIKGAA